MKQLASLFLALLTLTATAQINYPFNPDENADAFISTPDLMEFLVVFGYEWEQEEIQVDSIPLSMYLSSLEAMIEASALPEGTNPGQFLQWNGEAWELVMPKVGCTLPEACNYDPTAHVLFEDMCILQDECGVCDGPGAVYDCGCADTPEGDCDCDGNVVDALGACGGTCAADEDGDGICDDGDSCVGEADECGVCNGPGAIYGCGCSDIPEGACDCAGNVEDILGVCGGGCTADEDGDGICDDVDDCVGEYDGCGVCNGPGPVLGCGCNDIPEGYCDCNGNVLDAVGTCGGACQNDINGDGICDDDSIPGCTYDIACNYDPSASINDGSCDFTSCYGCTDIEACNYSPEATIDNGGCWYAAASYDCAFNCLLDSDGDGVCDDLEVFGCTDVEACNFEPGATELDESCTYPGCNDETACNFNPEAGCDDGSCVEEGDAGCIDPSACNFDESAICGNDSCEYLDECEVCGGTGTLGCTNPLASNYDALAACDDGSCIVYGCMVDLACNYEPTANVEDESCEFGNCPGCLDATASNYNPTSTNNAGCAVSFAYTGYPQIFIVPDTIDYIRVIARGASGGGERGGFGAKVASEFDVSPGDQLTILVGGTGFTNGDQGTGGGGGGTYVAIQSQPVVVAGGGGGSGLVYGGTGGYGGDASPDECVYPVEPDVIQCATGIEPDCFNLASAAFLIQDGGCGGPGGSGAGFYENGEGGAQAFILGGQGGTESLPGSCVEYSEGGYGGGGSSGNAGGGGGGWLGGHGGLNSPFNCPIPGYQYSYTGGGGGSSYSVNTFIENSIRQTHGNGSVEIVLAW